jgi:hypothetical protein
VHIIIFPEEFSAITDLEVGPDSYLYVLSIGEAVLYKIIPK